MKFRCYSDRSSQYNLSKNQLDAQFLCFVIRLLRLLHPLSLVLEMSADIATFVSSSGELFHKA
jgi:hypothetical protein